MVDKANRSKPLQIKGSFHKPLSRKEMRWHGKCTLIAKPCPHGEGGARKTYDIRTKATRAYESRSSQGELLLTQLGVIHCDRVFRTEHPKEVYDWQRTVKFARMNGVDVSHIKPVR